MTPGRLVAVELRRISLDLVTPFRTSFGSQTSRDILLLRATVDQGDAVVDGWGECVAMSEPHYSSEFVDAAELVLHDHLVPRLAGIELDAKQVAGLLAPIKGHQMAKAALEMAILDAGLRHDEMSFADWLGAGRTSVPSGVSVGIFDDIATLCSQVAAYVEAGYARIKLKIEPGWDIEPVREVRALIGDHPLQVDANTAYGRDDIDQLAALDEFGLLLIEQPLAEDDLLGHVQLAQRCETPVCLDESIHSERTAVDAIELGACSVVNIKAGRVGGYLEARLIHDACVARGVDAWCGGMVETGIGRAANVALAALDGFTLTGDISGADRFWRQDIVVDPIVMTAGTVDVPATPGLGFQLDMAFLDEVTTARRTVGVDAATTRVHGVSLAAVAHPFLSDEWIAAARAIREAHDDTPPVAVSMKMNQVITDVPFGDGTVHSYLDTTSGEAVLELGELDDPDVTITTDYDTAKAIFVDQDPAVGMQAFMSGKIRVQGDMMKLMALQTAMPADPGGQAISEEIRSITK